MSTNKNIFVSRKMLDLLSKNDREKYLAERKKIVDDMPIMQATFILLKYIVYVVAFLLLVFPLYTIAFGLETSYPIAMLMLSISKVAPGLIALCIAWDSIIIVLYLLMLDRLGRRYFLIETKVSARKGKN